MQCPKCKAVNSGGAQFCGRCHMTLLFKCPACMATQRQGGKCERCGVDFAKYAAMLIAQEQMLSSRAHQHSQARASAWKQAFLVPLTGGFSLLKFFFRRNP